MVSVARSAMPLGYPRMGLNNYQIVRPASGSLYQVLSTPRTAFRFATLVRGY